MHQTYWKFWRIPLIRQQSKKGGFYSISTSSWKSNRTWNDTHLLNVFFICCTHNKILRNREDFQWCISLFTWKKSNRTRGKQENDLGMDVFSTKKNPENTFYDSRGFLKLTQLVEWLQAIHQKAFNIWRITFFVNSLEFRKFKAKKLFFRPSSQDKLTYLWRWKA